MNKYLPSVSLVILLGSGVAMAGSAKAPYVGAGIGMNTSLDDNSLSAACGVGGVACREICDTDKAVNAYAGYPLSPSLAVEAGYTDMDYTARLQESAATGAAAGVTGNQQSRALTLSAVGRKALTSNFNVYGKLGGALWKSKATTSVGDASDTGVSPTVGAGVEYNFSEHWGVRAGWDRFIGMGDGSSLIEGGVANTVDEDVDTAMIDLHYNF